MNSFELYNPTKIIFGTDSFQKISANIPTGSKVLFTYGGGSIFKNGIYNAVKSQLNNIEHIEFGGIEANPSIQTLYKALDIIKKEKCTFLLAVGGGSVIDGTKLLAAAAYYSGDAWEIPKKGIKVTSAMPFGTVLTLPATGSEMNSGAVITNSETNEKLGMGSPVLFPKFSICNPEVIKSIPKNQLQNGIMDAFTHVLEQYLTYPVGGWLQDEMSEGILRNLIRIASPLLHEEYNAVIASNFMYSCTMALNGQIQKGVPTDWSTHMIGHELTANFGIDHAKTLCIIMPNLLRELFENKKDKLVQMAKNVWTGIDLSLEESQIASQSIEKLEQFIDQIGIKRKISDYTNNCDNIASKIRKTFEKRNWIQLGENKNLSPERVEKIVEMSI